MGLNWANSKGSAYFKGVCYRAGCVLPSMGALKAQSTCFLQEGGAKPPVSPTGNGLLACTPSTGRGLKGGEHLGNIPKRQKYQRLSQSTSRASSRACSTF